MKPLSIDNVQVKQKPYYNNKKYIEHNYDI